MTDEKNGMGIYHARMDADAMDFLANTANGDARAALNALELAVLTTEPQADKTIHITLEEAQECIQKRAVNYDKDGDNHYDTVSAFIKSMRGSDPDAALYFLARMLYAGEDVKFIARRIIICAAEDVGNADPNALTVAVSAAQAVERIGLPEGQIPLAQAVEERLKTVTKPITVAVMGCVVNGPGEAAAADVGIAGGKGEGLVFRRGEILYKVPEEKLVDALMEEIEKL